MKATARGKVRINNDLGMHLRAAGALVQLAGRFSSDIWLEYRGVKVNGKSIMSVLSLAAGKGVEIEISAIGDDAEEAVGTLVELVGRGFGLS